MPHPQCFHNPAEQGCQTSKPVDLGYSSSKIHLTGAPSSAASPEGSPEKQKKMLLLLMVAAVSNPGETEKLIHPLSLSIQP